MSDGSSALKRGLLRDDVYTRLRDAIVDGTFAPGEQLRDLDLAQWLGVSRTPVREALMRLGAAGLVTTAPGRSTTVAPLDVRTIRDAQGVVAAMHRLAVQQAVPLLTAFIRFCPLYAPLGISTCGKGDNDKGGGCCGGGKCC